MKTNARKTTPASRSRGARKNPGRLSANAPAPEFAARNWFAKFIERTGQSKWAYLGAVLLIFAPLVLAGAYAYRNASREMTQSVLSKRENIAYLTATVLTEKFDRLTDIGVSLATRVRFGELVAAGNWNDAIGIMQDVPNQLPFVERLFLADPRGMLRADTPVLPGVRGKDFSFRDWYLGVTRTGKPYVSHVYKRTAEPRIHVVAVSVPVTGRQGEVLGILVMQVSLEAFFNWFKDVPQDSSGDVYILDRNGHTAFHPEYALRGQTADLSQVRAVQRALQGERGVEIGAGSDDDAEHVTAFAPVSKYGWAVVLEEPASSAFAARDAQLWRFSIVYGLLLAFGGFAAYFFLRAKTSAQLKSDLERLVAERTAQLEQANKELEGFSYSVSHDLRAPLRAIDGFSQALLEDYAAKLDEQGKDFLIRVRAATGRMALLMDDLLNLGRITRAPLNREPVDLSALAEDIVRELRQSQPGRSVEIRIEPNLDADGDPQLLRVALANLLENAWKFTGKTPNAEIELGSSTDGSGQRSYYVRDNGAGFDMTYSDKLFGVFQRLHGQDEFPGTGIGLATVSRVVQRHGGRIWAESRVGEGSAFYFTL
jgi:signal transduction histidine kinase